MSGEAASPFNARAIAALIVAAAIGFIGFWLLSAFVPQLSSGNDGGAHALSRSATGYSVLVRLLEDAHQPVSVSRDDTPANGGLIILTPTRPDAEAMNAIRMRHAAATILVVLPKWTTEAHPDHAGWVRRAGLAQGPAAVLAGLVDSPVIVAPAPTGGPDWVDGGGKRATFRLRVPEAPLLVNGPGLEPVVALGDGMLIARLTSQPNVLILADADLLNNHGVAQPERAVSAIRLVTSLADGGPIAFDVTLNGFGAGRSLLRLAFTPPFLGLTLCLLLAAMLALWAGFVRFGPPWREQRAVALGKAALVANGAQLIVQAGRLVRFADDYAAVVREAAARRLHAPAGLHGDALDRWLDRFPDARGQRFSILTAALVAARSPTETLSRARALGEWRKDVLRDSQ